jgi:hypothetical protein
VTFAIAGSSALAVSALAIWLAMSGIREGVVRSRFDSCSRNERPVAYWITIALYVIAAGGSLLLVVLNIRDALLAW